MARPPGRDSASRGRGRGHPDERLPHGGHGLLGGADKALKGFYTYSRVLEGDRFLVWIR
ncbi:hypothetical protein AB0D62_37550 [Streptomyces massasporeus]|uniref:hypothetical protein n=1 Tax=Streptomyces massasporeus TaxID=67324 RepID=UPI0033DB87DC